MCGVCCWYDRRLGESVAVTVRPDPQPKKTLFVILEGGSQPLRIHS